MRHCFYHTDLGQKAVFHNFAIQIALNIQDDGGTRGLLAKPLKKLNHLCCPPVLTFVVRGVASVSMKINRVMLQHNKEFITLYVYFLFNGLTRGILSTPVSDVH